MHSVMMYIYNNNLLADGDNQGRIGDSGQSGGTGGEGNTEPCTDDFPCVSGDLLGMLIDCIMYCCILQTTPLGPGEDDLADVMEAVVDIAAKWKSLGLALGIRPADLGAISSKHPNDPNECLTDVLHAWLQQQHCDTKKFCQPSWKLLCQAVHKRVGGNNPALARKIAEEHS